MGQSCKQANTGENTAKIPPAKVATADWPKVCNSIHKSQKGESGQLPVGGQATHSQTSQQCRRTSEVDAQSGHHDEDDSISISDFNWFNFSSLQIL